MSLVLDAGALIALDRNERPMWIRLKALQEAGELPVTHGGVVGQVWRGGPRQTRLASLIAGSGLELGVLLAEARVELLAPAAVLEDQFLGLRDDGRIPVDLVLPDGDVL